MNKEYMDKWKSFAEHSQYKDVFVSFSEELDKQFMSLAPSVQYKVMTRMCAEMEKVYGIPSEESYKCWLEAQRCPGCNNKLACTCASKR